jgi:hypothetical protein
MLRTSKPPEASESAMFGMKFMVGRMLLPESQAFHRGKIWLQHGLEILLLIHPKKSPARNCWALAVRSLP